MYTISILVNNKIQTNSKREIISAQIDGSGFRYYYHFYDTVVKKLDFKLTRKELKSDGSPVYISVFDQTYSVNFSHIDSIIFKKIVQVVDSLNLKPFTYLSKATGFEIEKVYHK